MTIFSPTFVDALFGASRGRGKAKRTIALIDAAVRILEEIQPASIRAVCYRLFAEGLIPSMDKANTNRVSHQLARAREDGTLPWEWVVDETREDFDDRAADRAAGRMNDRAGRRGVSDQVAAALLFGEGVVDAVFVDRLQREMRERINQAGPLRRQARDVLLCALALELAPGAGPSTQARRVSRFLASIDPGAAAVTEAQRIALRLHELNEPIPRERQLQNILASISAMQGATDYRNGRVFARALSARA